MTSSKKTVVAGAAFLLFWGALATYAALLPFKARDQLAYDPVFFPALLIGLGIVFSLAIIGQGLYAARHVAPETDREHAPHDIKRVLMLMVIVGLYFAAMPAFGFIVSSVVFIPVLTIALGYRRWPVIVALAVLGPIAVWLIFTYGLKAPLPTFLGG